MDNNQTQTTEAAPKAERKSLGVVFPNNNKENPKSYDLKGTITLPEELVNFQLELPTIGCTELKSWKQMLLTLHLIQRTWSNRKWILKSTNR